MSNLTLQATAIGSLPYSNAEKALDLIFKNFSQCPMWPQLSKIDKHEDMTIQYLQGFPGIEYSEKKEKYFFNTQSDSFYEELEEFFLDFQEIVEEKNFEKIDKYGIYAPYTSSIPLFLEKVSETKPPFAKGHITGPFTLGTSICDENDRCAFYDETLKEILIKGLTMKALWQVLKIKEASELTTPIIFFDEPAMSQWGTSTFITVDKSDVICSLKEISEVVKAQGGLSGIHCCGKTDWTIIIDSNVNILNIDAFSFAKSLALCSNDVEKFLNNGNYIAWGIVPTLDAETLGKCTVELLERKLDDGIENLINRGIDKSLILQHSIITPSCGAGGLNIPLAEKAMTLTSELANILSKKYFEGAIN